MRIVTTVLLAALACAPAGSSTEPTTSTTGATVEPDVGPSVETRSAADANERYEGQGVVLGLFSAECMLVAESGDDRRSHHFEFPAECHFAKGDDGQPRVVETDYGPALMVESSRAVEQDCETALRVIVLTAAGPRLSKDEQRIAMCSPNGGDEMMYHVLASETVELGQ